MPASGVPDFPSADLIRQPGDSAILGGELITVLAFDVSSNLGLGNKSGSALITMSVVQASVCDEQSTLHCKILETPAKKLQIFDEC